MPEPEIVDRHRDTHVRQPLYDFAVGFYVARPHSTDIFSVVRALDDFESSLTQAVATINGPPPPPPPPCTGTVYVRSEPSGAEVWVDGVLMGSTPAKLTVNEGMRRVEVRLEGYTTWQREPSITCGSVVTLPVSLTKSAERVYEGMHH